LATKYLKTTIFGASGFRNIFLSSFEKEEHLNGSIKQRQFFGKVCDKNCRIDFGYSKKTYVGKLLRERAIKNEPFRMSRSTRYKKVFSLFQLNYFALCHRRWKTPRHENCNLYWTDRRHQKNFGFDPNYQKGVHTRVARFFFVQNTKTGKIYQISTNYTKCP
jgi:hypothetical protein